MADLVMVNLEGDQQKGNDEDFCELDDYIKMQHLLYEVNH
jgi:hypothetical protein